MFINIIVDIPLHIPITTRTFSTDNQPTQINTPYPTFYLLPRTRQMPTNATKNQLNFSPTSFLTPRLSNGRINNPAQQFSVCRGCTTENHATSLRTEKATKMLRPGCRPATFSHVSSQKTAYICN